MTDSSPSVITFIALFQLLERTMLKGSELVIRMAQRPACDVGGSSISELLLRRWLNDEMIKFWGRTDMLCKHSHLLTPFSPQRMDTLSVCLRVLMLSGIPSSKTVWYLTSDLSLAGSQLCFCLGFLKLFWLRHMATDTSHNRTRGVRLLLLVSIWLFM